jgi:hypothetical protein
MGPMIERMVVAANCCGVNGAGGVEYFSHGFESFWDEKVGDGYVWDINPWCVGASSYLLLLLSKLYGCLCARLALK